MNTKHAGLAACLSVILASGFVLAEEPAKAPAAPGKPLLENSRVKVLEMSMKPGEKIASHSHPDHVLYLLADSKVKETFADGKTGEIGGKAGQALWHAAVTHSAENVGPAPARALVVELKEPKSKPAAATPADKDPVKLASDSVKVLLDNDRVRVLEARVKPGGKIPMHSHPASVVYAVSDVKARITDAAGKPTEVSWKAGDVMWHEPVSHAVENVGPADVVVIDFELKEPGAPAK